MRLAFVAPIAVTALLASVTVSPAAAAPRADLEVGRLTVPPSRMSPGDSFDALALVRNVGGRRAPHTTTRLYLTASVRDESERRFRLAGVRTRRLMPGSQTLVSRYVRIPSDVPVDREYFLVACTDATNRVRESDERRNCFASVLLMFVEPR